MINATKKPFDSCFMNKISSLSLIKLHFVHPAKAGLEYWNVGIMEMIA
jgi:hypothetical protein